MSGRGGRDASGGAQVDDEVTMVAENGFVLIRRGLLEDLNGAGRDAETFLSLSARPNTSALKVTDFGYECLAALDAGRHP